MNGPSISDDMYVAALEKQCKDWEQMYADLKAENDQLKAQLAIATAGPSAMTEKTPTAPLRHVQEALCTIRLKHLNITPVMEK